MSECHISVLQRPRTGEYVINRTERGDFGGYPVKRDHRVVATEEEVRIAVLDMVENPTDGIASYTDVRLILPPHIKDKVRV